MERVGDIVLTWGESLRWDDRRQRLYFVDCAAQTLHWLNEGRPPLHTLQMPSLPTGLVLTEGLELVACLDDGLHVVDPDAGTVRVLTPYPDGMSGRANDANADGAGNLVTGTLNIAPGPGAFWWYSSHDGWRLLDDGNANGPVVVDLDGVSTLVFADTLAQAVYAYPYDASAGHSGTGACSPITRSSTAPQTARRPMPTVESGLACCAPGSSPGSPLPASIDWLTCRWPTRATSRSADRNWNDST